MNQAQFVQRPAGINYVQQGQHPNNKMNQIQMNQHISEMNHMQIFRQSHDMNQIQIIQQTLDENQMQNSRQSQTMNQIQNFRQSPETNQYQMVQQIPETKQAQNARKSIGKNKIEILRQFPATINQVQISEQLSPAHEPQIKYHVQIGQSSPTTKHAQFDRNSPNIIVISPNYVETQLQSIPVFCVPKKKITNAKCKPKNQSQNVKPIAIVSDSRVQKVKKVQLRVLKRNASTLPTLDATKLSTTNELILEKISPTPIYIDIKPKNNNSFVSKAQLQSTPNSVSQCTPISLSKRVKKQSLFRCQTSERVLFDNYGQFFIDRPCFEEIVNRNMTKLCAVEDDDIFWAKIARAS